MDAETLARTFHETYERLAPEHGYETRKESAKPWEEVPEQNRKLMVATCEAVLAKLNEEAAKALAEANAESARSEKAAWDDWDAKREEFESWRNEARSLGEHNEKLQARIKELEGQVETWHKLASEGEQDLIKKRDAVYRERDACVAAMARMAQNLHWPVGMARHPDEDIHWEDTWRNIVFFEIPVLNRGLVQLSWHVHDDEMELFRRLPSYPKPWDGHTTEEKYKAIAQFCGAL